MSWICPYCRHTATIRSIDTTNKSISILPSTNIGEVAFGIKSIVCPNDKCKKINLIADLRKLAKNRANTSDQYEDGQIITSWKLLPESSAKPLPDYIPEVICNDYFEACLIIDKSPKAAATLFRRCLQGMIRDFWKVSKYTLNLEIEETIKLHPQTGDFLHPIKDLGNIGAHPERDINLLVPIEAGEVDLMKETIEHLIEEWYVNRNKTELRKNKLKEVVESKEQQKKPPNVA